MIPTLSAKPDIVWLPHYTIIEFVEANSKLKGNKLNDFIYDHILNKEEDKTCWDKTQISDPNKQQWYDMEGVKWMLDFFNAHPFLPNRVMFVFDK